MPFEHMHKETCDEVIELLEGGSTRLQKLAQKWRDLGTFSAEVGLEMMMKHLKNLTGEKDIAICRKVDATLELARK
mgnify:CR=1 FL=1